MRHKVNTGQEIQLDEIDADLLQCAWQIDRNGYVMQKGKKFNRYMHREILSRMEGRKLLRHEYVDHKNRDVKDNRRENIRLASNSQNQANITKKKNNKSGRKGVIWSYGKWRVRISVRGTNYNLGIYTDLDEAAKAYQDAAIKYFGEYAYREKSNE